MLSPILFASIEVVNTFWVNTFLSGYYEIMDAYPIGT